MGFGCGCRRGSQVVTAGRQSGDSIFALSVSQCSGTYAVKLFLSAVVEISQDLDRHSCKGFTHCISDVTVDNRSRSELQNHVVDVLVGNDGKQFAARSVSTTALTHIVLARRRDAVSARHQTIE